MLNILSKYEEGTPAHKLYYKRIEEDMDMQIKHCNMQLEAIQTRQSKIIDGFLESKDKILEQTGKITNGMLEFVQKQKLELETSQSSNNENEALPNTKMFALEEKSDAI